MKIVGDNMKIPKPLSLVILASSVLGTIPCVAEASPAVQQKYSVEHGVKVYRNALSPSQKARRAAQVRQILWARQQDRARKAAQDQARRQHQHALQTAYERGFNSGFDKANEQVRHRNRNPYHYGRRYSTSFFGYPLGRFSTVNRRVDVTPR